ncbi:XrtA-associated tyrosine autokinase [Aliiglaciecola sp. CAU 1673]|uniref:XrtA-associated tyrosine autokinase n=1 Tax=Aliiglaciecola sp. CAU 1673 TaxID=3032595 RepID=UPI0023D9DD0F|nr:XrtA-associated tyrosine autokinase [Aliiglaciecola sp. CAU 1673]MDF2180034.1 XrtA-associated tyrosine autokinase [Aliiglaciecola sp. CAU 1673]
MSTIEKALQRKKAEAAEKARLEASEKKLIETENKSSDVVEEANPVEVSSVPENTNNNDRDDKPIFNIELDDEEFVSASSKRTRINEEFRAIKRKVLNNAFGPLSNTLNNPNIIMVTSANPGEGKTYNAINLALSIALEQDKTVLLVDADVLRPNVMRTLQLETPNGLMEYLLGEVNDVSEVMYHTSIDTLKIVPAGRSHHLSTELLASEKMLETVQEFAQRYADRVVIFDTPPLLGINETAVLANLAGQALVVVEENRTKLADINTAIDSLNPDMAKGFILNKARRSKEGEKGYGYYYSGNNA